MQTDRQPHGTDDSPKKTAETAFRWKYPERVESRGSGGTPVELSRMFVAEASGRFPAAVKYLAGAERNQERALTSCTSPGECTLALGAREMTPASAADMAEIMAGQNAGVYRCWECTHYSAVFTGGSIARNCVRTLSLADVLPSLPGLPVLIV